MRPCWRVPPDAVLLIVLATLQFAAVGKEAMCKDRPTMDSLQARKVACNNNMGLVEVLEQTLLAPGACLSSLAETARKLNEEKGFGFRVIYRPALRQDHGRVMEINPHLRKDIQVCETHEIDLYVGRWPFRQMPEPAFKGRPIGQAEKALQDLGFEPELRCADGEGELTNKALPVATQWPQPGELLGAHMPMSRFDMPDQQPLLFAECAAKLSECQQPEKCPLRPDPPRPDGPQSDSSSGDVALGSAAGLAGGLLLARVLRGQTPAPPAPRDAPPTSRTIVRVRHDLVPVEPSETRRDLDES